jgi:hypothetical protein
MDPRFQKQPDQRARPVPWGWALAGFLAIAAFFLLSEHRAHFLGALPWLLLLACPFLHFFMHGKHGHGGPSREGHGKHGHSDWKGGQS